MVRDVHISGERIDRITPPGAVRASAAAIRVDGAGRYLVPGFIDAHSHAADAPHAEVDRGLMLTYGVTGFRQMTGSPKMLEGRDHLSSPGDRMARPLAMPGAILTPLSAGTPALAAREVTTQVDAGADFIKAGIVSVEAFASAQDAARSVGIPFVGHLSPGVDVRDAVTRGMKCIEHLGPDVGVLAACTSDEDDIRSRARAIRSMSIPGPARAAVAPLAKLALARLVVNPVSRLGPGALKNLRHAMETFDESRAHSLAGRFAAGGTWHCPTLVRQARTFGADLDEYAHEPELEFVAPDALSLWRRRADQARKRSNEERAVLHRVLNLHRRLTAILESEGVGLIAGSDASGAMWEIPGHALHREFELLHESGLSPLRVLQTATCDTARFLGLEQQVGTIREGMRADLVVLGGNPLAGVDRLGDIRGVVLGGDYIAAGELADMRAGFAADPRVR